MNCSFWASAGAIDYGVDDLHYVSLMLDDLQSKFCVDARRIFETGFSNGGGLSGYLACTLANRIAVVARNEVIRRRTSGNRVVAEQGPTTPIARPGTSRT